MAETEDALEEALATYWAWTWIVAETAANQTRGRYSQEGTLAIRNVVERHLDRAPLGQRRWREGGSRDLWSALATQMVRARVKFGAPAIPLPLEQLLREPLPFECAEFRDVPCRFVGSGRIFFGAKDKVTNAMDASPESGMRCAEWKGQRPTNPE